MEPEGPYGVGHRQIQISGQDQNPIISVFYPIEKDVYEACKDNDERTSEWMVDGSESVKGMLISELAPTFLLTCLRAYRLRAINDADLHQDFISGSKRLTPVISSPSKKGTRTMSSGLIYQLVGAG